MPMTAFYLMVRLGVWCTGCLVLGVGGGCVEKGIGLGMRAVGCGVWGVSRIGPK